MNKRRGRPEGVSSARLDLISAASQLFTVNGYESTTLRMIAAEAGVDHSLVKYHFGSKDGLFNATLGLLVSPGALVSSALSGNDPHAAAQRLLGLVLDAWDRPSVQRRVRGLLVDIQTSEPARRAFCDYLRAEVTGSIAAAVGGADAEKRAAAAGAVVAGLFLTRYVVRLEPLASMPRADVVGQLSPVLQACLQPRRAGRRLRLQ